MRRIIAAMLAVLAPGVALAQQGTPTFQTLTTTGNATVGGTLQVGGAGTITGFGTAIGQALGPLTNFQGSGHPALLLSDRLILNRASPSDTDFAVLQIGRTTTFTSANHGNINQALVITTTVGANDGTTNWNALSKITANGPAQGQAVAHYFQAVRPLGGNQPMWVTVLESRDQSNLASSGVTGQQVNTELDVVANKADDATNSGSFGGTGNRKGLHMVVAQDTIDLGTPGEVSNLFWIAIRNPMYVDSVLGFAVAASGGQVRSVIDTRGAIPPTGASNPVNALVMSAGHVVDFNGGAAPTSAPGAYLQFRTGTGRFYYTVAGVDMWSIDSSGNVRAKGTLTGSTTP